MSMTWETAERAAAEMAEGVELGHKTQEAVGAFLLSVMKYQSRYAKDTLERRITELFYPNMCENGYWLALVAQEVFLEKTSSLAKVGSKEYFDDFEGAAKKDPYFRGCRVDAGLYRIWLEDSLDSAPEYLLERMQEQVDSNKTKKERHGY